jgi:hypothetical protein
LLSLRFPLEVSRGLRRIVWLMHGVAIMAVWIAFLPFTLKLVLTAVIAASQLREWARWAGPAVFLCYDEEQGWALDRPGDESERLNILVSTVVAPWVVFLHARSAQGHGRYAWALGRDGGDPGAFRRLRVWLRVGARLPGPTRPANLSDRP